MGLNDFEVKNKADLFATHILSQNLNEDLHLC